MSNPLALHSLHHLASLFAPAALGGSGGATAPPAGAPTAAHIDPLVVGTLLVAVGVIYAIIIVAVVCIVCWPRRLRWPEYARPDARPSSSATHQAASHRPLVAHRAAGTHPPTGGAAPGPFVEPPRIRRHTSAGWGQKHEMIAGSAFHDNEAWPAIEREIEGGGVVRWDGMTVRAFAGQPDVLQRLAFQRWRYQEGRCSEFAMRRDTPRTPGGEQRTPGGGQRANRRNERGQRTSAARRPGSRPPLPPSGRPTRVAQPTGESAGPLC